LQEGIVKPDGIELTVLTRQSAETRHKRMIRDQEFDAAELSMSNYLVARDHKLPFVAIPVFLHRRFRHGFIFINTGKGITRASDLVGRKIGLRQFQSTSNLWVRGILEHEHHVPHKSLHWFQQGEESLETPLPTDLVLSKIPAGQDVETMLLEGDLDGLIDPDVIGPIARQDPRVKRLFENYEELEIRYYQKTGIFPIMHTTAIKQQVVERHPWIPQALLQAFQRSKEIAYKRMENPRRVPLAWFRHALEEQERILGPDPWVYGLGASNRKNLETLIEYSYEQGLIQKKMTVDELFIAGTG
jgi:4,5-dihydroxyphthalate decarboxylase